MNCYSYHFLKHHDNLGKLTASSIEAEPAIASADEDTSDSTAEVT
jgi:hypothetical protein